MSGLSDEDVRESVRPLGNVDIQPSQSQPSVKPVVISSDDAEVVHGVLIEAVKRHNKHIREGLDDLHSWEDPGDCIHALVEVLTEEDDR